MALYQSVQIGFVDLLFYLNSFDKAFTSASNLSNKLRERTKNKLILIIQEQPTHISTF